MLNHIPMPDAMLLPYCVLGLWSLGSFVIASHLHYRWLSYFGLQLMASNCLIKGIIVMVGLLLIPGSTLITWTRYWPLQVAVAMCLGVLTIKWDKYIVRRLSAKSLGKSNKENPLPPQTPVRTLNLASKARGAQYNKMRRNLNKARSTETSLAFSLPTAILLACFEEIIFRGYLLILCWQCRSYWVVCCTIFFVMFVFCISHIGFGLHHVLAKVPLSLITTLMVLLCNSLLPSLIIHSMLNAFAYRENKKRWDLVLHPSKPKLC